MSLGDALLSGVRCVSVCVSDGGRVERGLGRSQELAAVDRPRIRFVKTGRDSLITADDLRSKDSNVTGEDITSQRDMNI